MRVLVFLLCMTALWAIDTDLARAAERSEATSQPTKSRARTDKDVHLALDKHKGAIYAAYARALRENPKLKGQILLSIAIAPNGRVTKCVVASSTLNDPAFERTIADRFCEIDFGPKGTKVYTDPAFPIMFYPA